MHDVPGQTHWHEPTGGKRAGFGKFGRPKTPYDNFMDCLLYTSDAADEL